jgi:two-component system cell cycle response regulator DivK
MTSPAPGPLVLIVDDNRKNLTLARDVLRAAGFRTLDAVNGAEALTLATEYLPDVVLLDLRLPDMDGADVARELRARTQTRLIPVVALSALQRPGDTNELHAVGFAGYLQKPINVEMFPDEVRSYCSRGASTPSGSKRTC